MGRVSYDQYAYELLIVGIFACSDYLYFKNSKSGLNHESSRWKLILRNCTTKFDDWSALEHKKCKPKARGNGRDKIVDARSQTIAR